MSLYLIYLALVLMIAPLFYLLRRFLERKTKFFIKINDNPKIKGLYNFLIILIGFFLILLGKSFGEVYNVYGGLILAFGFGLLLLVCISISKT